MTRWLSIEEQAVWRSWLVATSMMRERLSQDQEEGAGFSVEEYGLLVQLSEAEGRRLRMSSLAVLGLYSRSRLSHSISRLVDKGWVTKEPCDTDRRGAWAVLTKAGFEALEAAAPIHIESVREHLLDPLTTEQVAQLGQICATIAEHLCSIEGADTALALRVMGGPAPEPSK